MTQPAHLVDSTLLGGCFASDAMKAIFEDNRLLQSWLDVEAALAEAQADLGIVPAEAATEIRRQAVAEHYDVAKLGAEIRATSHPLIGVVRALAERCDGDAGGFVHWGATTQDIMDTGLVLQIREAISLTVDRMEAVRAELAQLARKNRDVVIAGRTHGQHGLPTTLGYKLAVMVAEWDRHLDRLRAVKERVLVGQFGGAVGSLASLGEDGIDVLRGLCERLGLAVPDIPWHTSRDGLAELVAVLAMAAASSEKVAEEVRVLQRTEVGELEEPNPPEKVGSSTMPHKRNPMVAENVIASARLTREAFSLALGAMVQEHERDMRAWGVEWAVLPQTFILLAGALEQLQWVLQGLKIDQAAMSRNLALTDGEILSEAVMMRLAAAVGRQRAHSILHQLSSVVAEGGLSFREAVMADETVNEAIETEELARLLDPSSYLGVAPKFVDKVLNQSPAKERI